MSSAVVVDDEDRVRQLIKLLAITGGTDMIGIVSFLDVAEILEGSRTFRKLCQMYALLDILAAELPV
jgi:hypothetical protein